QENEPEGEVGEVHGFGQADDGEQPGSDSTLSLGLPRDAADEGVAGETVTESGAYSAEPDGEAESDQCAGENQSVICHLILLMVFVLEAFARHAEVDHREQHEDERLDEADEDYVERLPDRQQQRADHGPTDGAHQRQRQGSETRDEADHDRARENVSEQSKGQRHGLDQLFEDVERRVDRAAPYGELERFGEVPQVAAPALNPDAVP